MNKKIFVQSGVAAFGDSWKAQTQRYLGVKSKGTITKWSDGTNAIPDGVSEKMKALLKKRQLEISKAIESLEND